MNRKQEMIYFHNCSDSEILLRRTRWKQYTLTVRTSITFYAGKTTFFNEKGCTPLIDSFFHSIGDSPRSGHISTVPLCVQYTFKNSGKP